MYAEVGHTQHLNEIDCKGTDRLCHHNEKQGGLGYAAVMKLPEKQAKRIYARYYLGMAVNEIAEVEGVDPSRVRDSIRRGLKQLAKYFQDRITKGARHHGVFSTRLCTLFIVVVLELYFTELSLSEKAGDFFLFNIAVNIECHPCTTNWIKL